MADLRRSPRKSKQPARFSPEATEGASPCASPSKRAKLITADDEIADQEDAASLFLAERESDDESCGRTRGLKRGQVDKKTDQETAFSDQNETEDAPQSDDFDLKIQEYAKQGNTYSKVLESVVPEECLSKPCMLGIDEAGRGPVCGPMVYGIAFCPIDAKLRLKKNGFADSKQLKEEQRRKLFEVIKRADDYIGWKVNILSASDISKGMLGRANSNLNQQSHDTAIDLIRRVLSAGVDLQEVYVDTVGKAETYQKKLASIFPRISKIVVESKADDKFPVVSAASICAKVVRDAVIEHWVHPEKIETSLEFGCGYPSDPATKAWLKDAFDPIFGVVRFSWKTASSIMEADGPEIKWEDDDDDEADSKSKHSKGTKKLTDMLPSGPSKKEQRSQFFRDRKLVTLTSIQ